MSNKIQNLPRITIDKALVIFIVVFLVWSGVNILAAYPGSLWNFTKHFMYGLTGILSVSGLYLVGGDVAKAGDILVMAGKAMLRKILTFNK
jgi:hypothetical protein